MKIAFYSQHVLGVGHFFRSLEICRALKRHQVFLISGGPPIETAALPAHVSEVRLPALEMDSEFKALRPSAQADLESVRRRRQERLARFFECEQPELFIIELYPFGRKAFRFELDPLLEALKLGGPGRCRVVCSVRDILVEKENAEKHESRAVSVLNRFFDTVLVHADPRLIRLEDTFTRWREISIPLVYTGFITSRPAPDSRQRIRTALGLEKDDRLIVASAGGGSVGSALIEAVVRAHTHLNRIRATTLQVFTGPFLPEADFERLHGLAGERANVARFTPDFLSFLAAADLSVSMAGYNTSMNLLAARVPALVWPFAQNREQRMRCERLEALGALRSLKDSDLDVWRLAELMHHQLERPEQPEVDLDLNGAQATARWVDGWQRAAAPKEPS
jgi:predicted glycosyltransferase